VRGEEPRRWKTLDVDVVRANTRELDGWHNVLRVASEEWMVAEVVEG
jgi:hypothetical protein